MKADNFLWDFVGGKAEFQRKSRNDKVGTVFIALLLTVGLPVLAIVIIAALLKFILIGLAITGGITLVCSIPALLRWNRRRRREAKEAAIRREVAAERSKLQARVEAAADQIQAEFKFRRLVADELVRREQG